MSQVSSSSAGAHSPDDPNVTFLNELVPGPNETQVRKRVVVGLLREIVQGREMGR